MQASRNINWKNPISRGLRHFYTFRRGIPWDEVLNEPGSYDGTESIVMTDQGLAHYSLGDLSNDVIFAKHDEIHGNLAGLTVMTRCKNTKDLTTDNFPDQEFPFSHAGAGIEPWNLRYRNGTGNEGDIQMSIYMAGPTQYTSTIEAGSTFGISPDTWQTWGGTWDGSNLTARHGLFLEDTSPASTTGTPVVDAGANYPRLGGPSNSSQTFEGWVLFGAMWDRALTPAEWAAMVMNPAQLLKPLQNNVIYMSLPAPVAAGSTVTITDVNTTESWNDGDSNLIITGSGFV